MFNKGQIAGLMKQAQAMQDNLKKAQDELGNIEVEGESGAGLVEGGDDLQARCQARHHSTRACWLRTRTCLEDLVAAAFNAAVRKAEETSNEKMSKLTAGMPWSARWDEVPLLKE